MQSVQSDDGGEKDRYFNTEICTSASDARVEAAQSNSCLIPLKQQQQQTQHDEGIIIEQEEDEEEEEKAGQGGGSNHGSVCRHCEYASVELHDCHLLGSVVLLLEHTSACGESVH